MKRTKRPPRFRIIICGLNQVLSCVANGPFLKELTEQMCVEVSEEVIIHWRTFTDQIGDFRKKGKCKQHQEPTSMHVAIDEYERSKRGASAPK